MSILIKGMKMPKSCEDCRFCDNDSMCVILGEDLVDYVPAFRYLLDDWKYDACPLVEIPSHGRLIDADELSVHNNYVIDGIPQDIIFAKEERGTYYHRSGGLGEWEVVVYKDDIDAAPTIIEAEDNND